MSEDPNDVTSTSLGNDLQPIEDVNAAIEALLKENGIEVTGTDESLRIADLTEEQLDAIVDSPDPHAADDLTGQLLGADAVEEQAATPVAEPKRQLVLDPAQQVMVSRWITHLNHQPATPVEEHELLTAVSTDVTLRDYVLVGLLHDWLSDEIDGVGPAGFGVQVATEALEETLGRCANDSPEKSACQAMLFTARLGEQMQRSNHDYMKALSWMSEDDVQMLVDASTHATPEMAEYISVLVQSVAVTKVTS